MSMLTKALRATGLNKPGKLVAKAATRAIPGAGLVIGGAQAVLSLAGGGGSKPKPPATFTGSRPGLDFGDIGDFARRLTPGGATGRGRVAADPNTGRCPQGYHMAKDGRGCVRNRRMNAANGRAIARATRRLRSAEKMFRRILQVQGKPTGKIKPKGRKR